MYRIRTVLRCDKRCCLLYEPEVVVFKLLRGNNQLSYQFPYFQFFLCVMLEIATVLNLTLNIL